MKLTTFFISRTTQIKVMSGWTLSELLFTSAVIWKQRLLHGNEIEQYL